MTPELVTCCLHLFSNRLWVMKNAHNCMWVWEAKPSQHISIRSWNTFTVMPCNVCNYRGYSSLGWHRENIQIHWKCWKCNKHTLGQCKIDQGSVSSTLGLILIHLWQQNYNIEKQGCRRVVYRFMSSNFFLGQIWFHNQRGKLFHWEPKDKQ